MKTNNEINSIARAAEVLKLLASGVDKMTEISRRLDVNKATVHRIMKTLESKGLVSQDVATRRYYLGPLIQSLAENPLAVHRIVGQTALSEMERLRDLFGETVVLQIRRGVHRLILEKVEGNQSIRYLPATIESSPIHAGAGAKVLLSEMNQAELAKLLSWIDLVKIGPNTIADKEELVAELDKVRSQGFAVAYGEIVEGGASIAVPVHHYSFPVAMAVIGPEERIRNKRSEILEELEASAVLISDKISNVTGIQSVQK